MSFTGEHDEPLATGGGARPKRSRTSQSAGKEYKIAKKSVSLSKSHKKLSSHMTRVERLLNGPQDVQSAEYVVNEIPMLEVLLADFETAHEAFHNELTDEFEIAQSAKFRREVVKLANDMLSEAAGWTAAARPQRSPDVAIPLPVIPSAVSTPKHLSKKSSKSRHSSSSSSSSSGSSASSGPRRKKSHRESLPTPAVDLVSMSASNTAIEVVQRSTQNKSPALSQADEREEFLARVRNAENVTVRRKKKSDGPPQPLTFSSLNLKKSRCF